MPLTIKRAHIKASLAQGPFGIEAPASEVLHHDPRADRLQSWCARHSSAPFRPAIGQSLSLPSPYSKPHKPVWRQVVGIRRGIVRHCSLPSIDFGACTSFQLCSRKVERIAAGFGRDTELGAPREVIARTLRLEPVAVSTRPEGTDKKPSDSVKFTVTPSVSASDWPLPPGRSDDRWIKLTGLE